jgi:hypothetical protein
MVAQWRVPLGSPPRLPLRPGGNAQPDRGLHFQGRSCRPKRRQRGKRVKRAESAPQESRWRPATNAPTPAHEPLKGPGSALWVFRCFWLAWQARMAPRCKSAAIKMIAVTASQSQTFPETLLMDTATEQTWILYHETGQSIEWLPLRFSAGKDRPATPLPPSPDVVGVSR